MEPKNPSAPRGSAATIGPDRVVAGIRRLIVDAAAEMPDWQVRRFRRTAVFHVIHVATQGAMTPGLDPAFWLALALMTDAAARTGLATGDEVLQPGLFEWACSPGFRRNREAEGLRRADQRSERSAR